MSDFTPTAEQQAALDLFATGRSFAIQAGAGSGKTSTMVLLAEAAPNRVGRYVAFNKAVVTDVAGKVPDNVTASTMHSLAFRAVGRRYSHRLNSARVRSEDIARQLRIQSLEVVVRGEQGAVGRKTLAAGFLAGHVMKAVTRYCQSTDATPGGKHVAYIDGIDLPDETGRRTWDNNDAVRDYLAPFIVKAWADMVDPKGQLPYRHDAYLKLWALSDPVIDCDFILYDEVQDADPVQAQIILAQHERGVQVVICGDEQQAIYEWRGAIDAFRLFNLGDTTFLTQSWRFGDAVAAKANEVLSMIPNAKLRLRGTPAIPSSVAAVGDPKAVLCRTNASAVREVLGYVDRGKHPHLVGGGSEVVSFARAAKRLMAGQRADHPDLGCFDNWGEVLEYTRQDAQGDELRLLVRLVDEFGPDRIIATLGERMPSEDRADVVVSTAHKAKGREWDTVRLAGDFASGRSGGDETGSNVPELRLLYVAVTRARLVLDVTLVPLLADPPAEAEEDGEAVVESDALLDGTIQPEQPRACPDCGRTDVYRSQTGLVGVHRCEAVAR